MKIKTNYKVGEGIHQKNICTSLARNCAPHSHWMKSYFCVERTNARNGNTKINGKTMNGDDSLTGGFRKMVEGKKNMEIKTKLESPKEKYLL